MKRISLMLSIFGIIGFIVLQAGNKTTVADARQDLLTLASRLQDEHILIKKWSLYSRETLESVKSGKDRENLVRELKGKFSGWSWTESKKENQHIVTATNVSSQMNETLKIISTVTNGQIHTYLLYEVKGGSWDKRSESFLDGNLPVRLADIFENSPETFSCIEGVISDKMDEALPNYMDGLLKAFDATEIEALEEDTFMSTSAYSPLFAGQLSKDHDMNLQLGLRKPDGMGGKTTIVVGTPIITIEY
ncbi:YwmB family TATA-box binding protein [Mesobacillus foraminis]|uniref:YwmB family TATA-box binding protein n=2 Tax=Mesobacillus foraminis TaxID=279826 RepID=UPI000EF4FE5D|nr:YwmB family TATA-box binding protein [Mesobacillus foraminis]MBT2756630.1 YwmB family TATA-box binding protein [Mesobacillus foraminis]